MKKYLIFYFLAFSFDAVGQYTIEKIHTFSDFSKSVHIEKVVFSPDGTHLLMNSSYAVYLYSMKDLTRVQRFKDHKYDIYWIGFAANNDFFYSWSHREYKLITRQSSDFQRIAQVEGVSNFGWSHDNQWFVVARWRDSTLEFRNGRDFKMVHKIKSNCHSSPVFSKDDQYLFVPNPYSQLYCHQMADMERIYIFKDVGECQLSPEGAYIACIACVEEKQQVVKSYRLSDFYPVCEFRQEAKILNFRWSPDGQYLLVWTWSDNISPLLYNMKNFKYICSLTAENEQVSQQSTIQNRLSDAAISSDGKWLTFWTQAGQAYFYSLGDSIELIETINCDIKDLVIHPDGQHFVILSYSGDVTLYKLSKK